MAENAEVLVASEETKQDKIYYICGKKVILDVDIDTEIKFYGVETKFNDYIGMQKGVVSMLRKEGFFDNNVVINEETEMQIAITAKGIKETLGSGNRFQTLPRELKRLKVATVHSLPHIITKARLIKDNTENTHGNNPLYAYFYADIVIDGIDVGVKIDVRKTIETNKFWIHNVEIKKNSDTLSPATTQVLKERTSSSEKSKPRNEVDVNKKFSY